MPLRNGEHGYGSVTKVLHWATFAVVVAQFVVGYTMVAEDPRERFDRREEACEATADTDAAEDAEDRCEDAVDRQEDAAKDAGEDDGPTRLHVGLGVAILVLALARLLWRATTPLPPWAPALSNGERWLEAWLEKGLLTLLLLIPVSGWLLVAVSDDWLALHVAAHVAFFVVVGLHVGLVLKHTVVQRDRHLARML